MTHAKLTDYGFEFGAAEVTRTCSDDKKGWVLISVITPRADIRIYVTKTGKVRVHNNKTRKELK